MDEAGRPSFNALQNHGSTAAALVYYAFDVMVLAGKDVMSEPLNVRRKLLWDHVLSRVGEPIRESPELAANLPELIHSVKALGLEGLVAKRIDSRYEPGQRTGKWQKMRIDRGQPLVIGGYTLAGGKFDAIVFGYFDEERLMYAGRTRHGFTPASRDQLFRRFAPLASETAGHAKVAGLRAET